jgi:hypothetical protein
MMSRKNSGGQLPQPTASMVRSNGKDWKTSEEIGLILWQHFILDSFFQQGSFS